jgi:hypothetical protein
MMPISVARVVVFDAARSASARRRRTLARVTVRAIEPSSVGKTGSCSVLPQGAAGYL